MIPKPMPSTKTSFLNSPEILRYWISFTKKNAVFLRILSIWRRARVLPPTERSVDLSGRSASSVVNAAQKPKNFVQTMRCRNDMQQGDSKTMPRAD